MSADAQRVLEDLMRVLSDIDELVKKAAATSGAEEAEGAIAHARSKLLELKTALGDDVRRGITSIDGYFRDRTWTVVGTAAAVAFIAGLILGRPPQR